MNHPGQSGHGLTNALTSGLMNALSITLIRPIKTIPYADMNTKMLAPQSSTNFRPQFKKFSAIRIGV